MEEVNGEKGKLLEVVQDGLFPRLYRPGRFLKPAGSNHSNQITYMNL